MSLNLKRPKRIGEEDEEDLIRFQEEFLKNKAQQPAAKVIKKQPRNDSTEFVETNRDKKDDEHLKEMSKKKPQIDFENDKQTLAFVLSDIVEKPLIKDWSDNEQKSKKENIPQIEKLKLKELLITDSSNQTRKNKSLFAQNLERQGKLKSHFALNQVFQPNSLRQDEKIKKIEEQLNYKLKENLKQSTLSSIQTRRQIITGEGLGNTKDVEQIHLENLELLSKMNPEEILAEQQKLIQQLDPKILAFIKHKNLSQYNNLTDLSRKNCTEEISTSYPTDEEILEQLPFKPNKKWLHMDKIEYDKLEWMLKPRNAIKNDSKESSSARFDFSGNLISPEEDISVTKALHHHGNEPDQAGYTLDELFYLARSKFNQQRVIALQTIGNILKKCHQGYYYDLIRFSDESNQFEDETNENDKNNLLNQLIEGGVIFLLRWSLDDQTESIINASLNSLKELLQPTDQEKVLDYVFDLYKGFEGFCMHPFSSIFSEKKPQLSVDKKLNVNEEKSLDELKDDEFIRHDLIRGLFRMNLIERFFYLLNKYQPNLSSNQIQSNIFMILFRCMRHSPELCYDFTEKYSNLLDLIMTQFLPSYIDPEQSELANILSNITYSLKLIRLISSAGPTIANKLYKKYDLKIRIINYLTLEKYIKEPNLTYLITVLQTETIRLLKTLILYSENEMGIECVVDFYEILITHFNSLIGKFCLKNNEQNICLMQALISLFDSLILTLKENDQNSEFKSEICSSFYSIISTFVLKQFKNYFENKQDKIELNLISVCINFMTDYLEKMELFSSTNKTDLFNKKTLYLDVLIENIISPIINKNEKINQLKFDDLVMSKMLTNSTSSNSDLIHNQFKKIKSNNLTYLPIILNLSNDENDFLRNGPFCFLTSYLRLFNLCFKYRLKIIDDKSFTNSKHLMQNSYLKSYLKAFCKNINQNRDSANNSYFIMKFENYFIFNILKVAFNVFNFEDEETTINNNQTDEISLKSFEEKRFFYLTALGLILNLKSGDEFILNDILNSILFNTNFWSIHLSKTNDFNQKRSLPTENNSFNFLIKYFERLELNNLDHSGEIEFSYLNTNFGQSETIRVNKKLIENMESLHIYETLNQIKFTYLDNSHLINPRLLKHSKLLNNTFIYENLNNSKENQLKNLFTSNFYSNKYLLKPDWMYAPIMTLISQMQKIKKENLDQQDLSTNDEKDTNKIISTLSNCLKFIYLIESYFESDYLDLTVNHTQRYIKLLYVYLFDTEVYLDKKIITIMYLLFFKYSIDKRQPLQNLNFNQKFDEIISFYDFFQHLCTHYDSSSFGDYLFSQYLIVPLQQCYPVKFRQLFWSDFYHLFKYMRFDTEKTKLLIPLKNFIHPNEKSLHMIRLYSQILLDRNDFNLVCNSKLGYTILIASLNSFIFEHINKLEHGVEFDFKKLLVKQFLILNEKLKNDLINFKGLNSLSGNIEIFVELPSIRKNWLNSLMT